MDDGKVHVFAGDGESADKALQMIRDVTASAEIGKTYLGKVVPPRRIRSLVEIFPGTDGLLHISEIAEQRIKDVRDELKLGDQVLVKVLAIEGNKIRLSRKAVLREQREKTTTSRARSNNQRAHAKLTDPRAKQEGPSHFARAFSFSWCCSLFFRVPRPCAVVKGGSFLLTTLIYEQGISRFVRRPQ